jgi:hypothetical protein
MLHPGACRLTHRRFTRLERVAKTVFLFFSNRLGCLGSIALSVVLTVVLLFLLGVL